MSTKTSQRLSADAWNNLYKRFQDGCRQNPDLNYSQFLKDLREESLGPLPITLRTLTRQFGLIKQREELSENKTKHSVKIRSAGTAGPDVAEITAVALPEKPARSKPNRAYKRTKTTSQPGFQATADQPGVLEARIGRFSFRIPDRAAAEIFCDIAARLTAQGI